MVGKDYSVVNEGMIGGDNSLALIAGRNAAGELVIENVLVSPQSETNAYLLLKSPMFVRGIARGDEIQVLDTPKGAFKVLNYAGNLCIRVFGKHNLVELEQTLTPEIEKLGGDLDICEERALVYSIHVSCGFNIIEQLLNDKIRTARSAEWIYGNVYDPESGEPLNWWLPILSPD